MSGAPSTTRCRFLPRLTSFSRQRQDHDSRRHRRRRCLRTGTNVPGRFEHRHRTGAGPRRRVGAQSALSLFYPDRNNDDVPDGDPEVHLAGFRPGRHALRRQQPLLGPRRLALRGPGVSTVTAMSLAPGSIRVKSHTTRWVSSSGDITPKPPIRGLCRRRRQRLRCRDRRQGRIYSGHNGGDTRGFHYVQGATTRRASTSTGRFEPVCLWLLPGHEA